MSLTVYPVGSSSGFSEESQLDSELHRLMHAFGGRLADFIVSPFGNNHYGITTSGSSLDVDIAAGKAIMSGFFVENDAAVTLSLDANATNEIFLVIADDRTNNAAIEYTSDGSPPSNKDATKLWTVTTDGSGVTGTTDERRYVAFPEDDPDESITGLKTGMTGTVPLDSTGIVTVDVTFTNPYRVRIDSALATLNEITDTAADFGWIRTKNISVTGFTVEAKVSKTGAGGSTADFYYQANGK